MELFNNRIMVNLRTFCQKNSFLLSIVLGVIIGIILGVIYRYAEPSPDVASILAYPGELFLRALKMIVLPFIICCIIIGTATLNITANKMIAVRVLLYFFLTCWLNVMIGLALGLILKPGNADIHAPVAEANKAQNTMSILDSLLDVGRNLITDNFFEATFQQVQTDYKIVNKPDNTTVRQKVLKTRNGTNSLGIIFFCVLFGCILGTLEKQKKILLDFFQAIYDILLRILIGIIWFTPFGVASIVCHKIATVPNILGTLSELGLFVAISICGLLIYQLVIAQLIYFVIVKKNPFKYYLSILPALVTGFATASKAASLPSMFQVMDKLKKNKRIVNFVLPIGTINLNGSAQYIALTMVFLSQLEGRVLGVSDVITLMFACTFASMSSAAIPSAAIVMVTILCSAINISADNITLLLSVDWLIDRFRTSTNVLGDCYTVAVVEQLSQKELKNEKNEPTDTLSEEPATKTDDDIETESTEKSDPSVA